MFGDFTRGASFATLPRSMLGTLSQAEIEELLAAGETPVRSGNGHASIYRIHLLEKTGRFERR